MSLTLSVDVEQRCTMLRHWSQFVPNMSTDIRGHEALHHQKCAINNLVVGGGGAVVVVVGGGGGIYKTFFKFDVLFACKACDDDRLKM